MSRPWFHRIEVPTPYKVGPANAYAFDRGPLTLFDCGPNMPEVAEALREGLGRIGRRIEDVERLVVSHGHPDHYGLARSIVEASGATVLAGADDVPKLTDSLSSLSAGALLVQAGIPVSVLADMESRHRDMDDLRPPVRDVIPLRGGERLDVGEAELEVLHLPGHTAGHVCLLERDRGVLFSGDTLLLDISPNPLLEPSPSDPSRRRRSLVEYLASLDVVDGLELGEVWPGHGEPILDPHGLIARMRAHHLARKEVLAARLEAAGQPRSAWDLAGELFSGLEGFDHFLAVSEVVAHLDLLVAEGRATSAVDGGVERFSPSDAPGLRRSTTPPAPAPVGSDRPGEDQRPDQAPDGDGRS